MTNETTAPPLLVEDVLLLLFQPSSHTIAGESILYYVLGGAVVTDLATGGYVDDEPGPLGSTRVRVTDAEAPGDPVLAPAWRYIAEKPRGVQTVLAAVGPPLREEVLERLVERGELALEEHKTLGLFRTTRPALVGERRARLIDAVRATLVDGAEPDARTASTIALLSASDTLPQFDAEIPWSADVYHRSKALERGEWGAAAAAQAVTRTMTAIIAGAVAAALTVPRS